MSVADLFAAWAAFLTGGLFRAFDQSTVRGEVLDGWEAVDTFDLIEDDEAQYSADAGDSL